MTECSVNRPCWLTATGDSSSLHVYRSPLVKRQGRMFGPVLEHITTNGLKLVYTETEDRHDWMHRQRVREIYA